MTRGRSATRSHVLVAVGAVAVLLLASAVWWNTLSRSGAQGGGPPVIGARGGSLTLGGTPTTFVGVNAYELATDWGTNAGCGTMLSDDQLDAFFASLPPHALVRFWAFQGSMALDVHTDQIDWGPLQRVFTAAAAQHDLLIPVLTQQGSGCDGTPWQDVAWYSGGYATATIATDPTTGLPEPVGAAAPNPLSYLDYVTQIVTEFRSSPALGMWEPISEPEASTCASGGAPSDCYGSLTCPDEQAAAQALRGFFDTVGALIHQIDPRHLVESGTLGGGQCGTSGSDYVLVGSSPGLDVLSYHDYYPPTPLIGADQWNGIGVRQSQAAQLGKPLIAGEMGIEASTAPPAQPSIPACVSVAQRASDLAAKVRAQLASGTRAVLVWNWSPNPIGPCDYNTTTGDPLMGMLRRLAS
jgi:mannan endo-1,4-beta-mannosidase